MSNVKKPKKQPKGDYPVGYARPPHPSQFKKGQSGNPKGSKGRKRKAPTRDDLRDALFEMMEGLVPVKVNGVPTTMKAINALLRQILSKALSGDFRSQMLLIEKFEGNIVVEDAIRESQKHQLPERIEVRFVESDGNGGLSEKDRDLAPGYKGPPPNLREVKPGELRAANSGEAGTDAKAIAAAGADDDEEDWLK